PMNGIMGMTELLLATDLNKQQREYVGLVNHSAESLLTIITDILDFSKIEAGKLQLDAHEFDLRDAIGDTLQTLGIRADEKHLELAYNVGSDVPDCLVGDLGRIRQVLVNLVGNALKFTDDGEVVVDIRRESGTVDGVFLHFKVQDTGIGIAPEKLHEVFDSFTQAEGSTTRTYGGTGLGLAISRKLVELMGGRIWVESELGKGCTFHFTIHLGIGREDTESLPAAPASLQDLPVLVVDDNRTNRSIVQGMLRTWGMAPEAVESGSKALDSLAAAKDAGRPYPLVVLDVMMPGMDGMECIRRIRENFGEAAPVIIVLSSAGHMMPPDETATLGVARVLTKPVKQSDLLDAITRQFRTASRDRHATPEAPAPRPAEISPMNVLLAEDGRVNQMVATNLLKNRGHRVVIAEDGEAALERHAEEDFDAILMDVMMPRLDGLGATRAIREREEETGKHVPIIAMTANAMKGDRERCLAAGMDAYVSKPVRSSELFAMLEQFAPDKDRGAGDAPEG
ncbi:MAG: response regulator, partial [Akkermansiaceae bacterium]|nr:response regulator [Akkermansiaceae bacterium]